MTNVPRFTFRQSHPCPPTDYAASGKREIAGPSTGVRLNPAGPFSLQEKRPRVRGRSWLPTCESALYFGPATNCQRAVTLALTVSSPGDTGTDASSAPTALAIATMGLGIGGDYMSFAVSSSKPPSDPPAARAIAS